MRRRALMTLAVAILLSSCTGDSSAPEPNVEDNPTASSTDAATMEPGDRTDDVVLRGGLRLVERMWDWDVIVDDLSRDYLGSSLADRRHLVTAPATIDRDSMAVIDRDTGEQVALVAPPRGRYIGDVALSHPYLVWDQFDRYAERPTLHVLDLRTMRERVVNGAPDALDPGAPVGMSVFGHHVAYSTQDGQDTNCLAVTDLRTMTSDLIDCTEQKRQGLGEPSLSADGLAAVLFTPLGPQDYCNQVVYAAGPVDDMDRLEPVPGDDACGARVGVVGDDWIVWDSQRPFLVERASMFVADTEQGTQRLPDANANTLVRCGDWVYWNSWAMGTQAANEYRRWRPGSDEIEVIYRAVRPEAGHTVLSCHGETMTFARTAPFERRQELLEARVPAD